LPVDVLLFDGDTLPLNNREIQSGTLNMDKTMTRADIIAPYGGQLVNLLVPQAELAEAKAYANTLLAIQISERAMCDLELLAIGGFSPLDQFMGQETLQRVLDEMRLPDGTLFPMPITLPVDDNITVEVGQDVALHSTQNDLLAIMTVDEIYEWDVDEVSQKAFGTLDRKHPIVAEMQQWGKRNIAGKLRVLHLPPHPDFADIRFTPAETRARLAEMGHANVVAFQTRNPMHRVHEELTKRAIAEIDGALLLHPVVGMTKPGDVDYYTRVRTYKALVENHYEEDRVLLSLLPLAMRMGGPREAVWHAIIRRNYGANHLIVGRDHAGPGKDSNDKPFYGPYDAQDIVTEHFDELGVKVIPFAELVYLADEQRYEEVSKIGNGARTLKLSGTQVRDEYLNKGMALPDWFSRPQVARILMEAYPPRNRQGVCVWFTGLSGSGKSTTAEILTMLLLEHGRQATVLDGDVVRTHLSKGLGFSKEDRDTNIRRIGFVASEIVRHGGTAVCAAISPYRAIRDEVRAMVGPENFVEIFMDTPLDVCEERDKKGLYAKARRGEIKGFTGIDDPYEVPFSPEISLNTVDHTAEENAHLIINYLKEQGYIV
jgi:sulfate adenylyltransferase